MSSMSPHVDPETIAAFAEGRLDAAKRDSVIAHIDRCEDCLEDVALVMPSAAVESQRRRFGRPSWLLALAAALVLAVALPFAWHFLRHGSATDELVSLSPRSARIVEPRLTGGFPWAAYHGSMRAAGGSATDTERLKLGGAAGDLMQRAEHDPSAEAQHAAGVALVLVEKPEDAIAKLESAASASHDAKSWSDLAAARYAAAVQFRRPSLYPEALAAADDALRIDAKLPEALFNRALILETMGLISEARKAWQRYLEVDPGSQWANEARDHLAKLPATTGASRWERDQPLLEAAAVAGDARKTLALVDTYRERARRFAEAEYLGRWAEAVQQRNDVEATKWLTISRGIGNALAQLSGESLLRDAVRAIDGADAHTRAKIAEAHVIYRRGRIAFSHQQPENGERDLRQAAALFESAADPMSLMARHYAASARLARNDVLASHAELKSLLADADAQPAYLALGAQIRWELARSYIVQDDPSNQVAIATRAAEMFHRAGENASEAFVESMLATTLTHTGSPDEAWAARVRSFHALSTDAETTLLCKTVGAAVRAELRAGRTEAALALSSVTRSMLKSGTETILEIETLLQKAMLESITGNSREGRLTTRQAEEIAASLSDPDLKARQLADVAIAYGAQLLATDPRAANRQLTHAIDFYRTAVRPWDLPEPLLLRARSSLRMGDSASAAGDLEAGIQILEHQPPHVEGVVLGTGVLDAATSLFADAIRLHLDRGDRASAFAYAERWRGGEPLAIDELQRRLAGSGAAVLEIVSLPDEVITFAISRDDVAIARRPLTATQLLSLAENSIADDEHAAETLYDEIVRPVDRILTRASSLIIVPDPALAGVPFAALVDSSTRRYLIERLTVLIAANASSLQRAPATIPQSLAGIALPTGDGAAVLPEEENELADVIALYPRARSVGPAKATWAVLQSSAAAADVVHIVGHTERQPAEGEQALLFAGTDPTRFERVSWKTILAAPSFRAKVIVLAACETLRPPRSSQTRALSLGAAFAAGGADVIGTLAPIPDRDGHALFRAIHRRLAAGVNAADAVRETQLESLRAQGRDARAWRALAVLTHHIYR